MPASREREILSFSVILDRNNDAAGGRSRWADLSIGSVGSGSVSSVSRDKPYEVHVEGLRRRLVHASVLYLPIVLGMMVACEA